MAKRSNRVRSSCIPAKLLFGKDLTKARIRHATTSLTPPHTLTTSVLELNTDENLRNAVAESYGAPPHFCSTS